VASSDKHKSIVESDSSKWAPSVPSTPIFFSALGTTLKQAGSLEKQRKIDYDLNVELAQAAKAAGVKVYVLISTAGASTTARFPYTRMKAELDEAVKALDFEHTVIVKPGLISGTREDSRPAEAFVRGIASVANVISGGFLKDFWSQDADVIAKAAVTAGLKCLEKPADCPKVWEVTQSEVIRLGRTEWKA
jgi:uncharacterized protein YbjT (DUF2867 family)